MIYIFNRNQPSGVFFISKKDTYSLYEYDGTFKFIKDLSGKTALSQLTKDAEKGELRYTNACQVGKIFSYRNELPAHGYDWTVFKVTSKAVSCADACKNKNIVLDNTCVIKNKVSCTLKILDKYYFPVIFEYLEPDYGGEPTDVSVRVWMQGAKDTLRAIRDNIGLRFTNFCFDESGYTGDVVLEFSAKDMHYEPLHIAKVTFNSEGVIVNGKQMKHLTDVTIYKCLLFDDFEKIL